MNYRKIELTDIYDLISFIEIEFGSHDHLGFFYCMGVTVFLVVVYDVLGDRHFRFCFPWSANYIFLNKFSKSS